MSEEEPQRRITYAELKASSFKQNTFWSWRPSQSACKSAIIFIISGLTFLVIGVLLLFASTEVVEKLVEYSDADSCLSSFTIKFTEPVKAPIFVYYEIPNLHQNYRRFSASRSTDQLEGVYVNSLDKVDSCFPVKTEAERLGNLRV